MIRRLLVLTMVRLRYARVLLLISVLAAGGVSSAPAQPPASVPVQNSGTIVRLHWGKRPGVFRYRLQVSGNSAFTDIVFDRLVNGEEITINDLAPGRYFWRIAALTNQLSDFSSIAQIDVAAADSNGTTTSDPKSASTSNGIDAGGGWYTAVGDVSRPVLAHLRTLNQFDIVATNTQGVTTALDASTGLALWSFIPRVKPTQPGIIPPLIVPGTTRLDHVLVFAGNFLIKIDGASGRELWRAALPGAPVSAVAIGDANSSQIVVLDNTRQQLVFVDDAAGRISTQVRLPQRVIEAPLSLGPTFIVGYGTGAIEVRDRGGAILKSGHAGSALTTGPAIIRGPRGNLLLVGTREGLTAMTADDLRPLGRLALKDDTPNGFLLTNDLDGNGIAEAVVMTLRRHLVAVDAAEGKLLWDVAAPGEFGAAAFADLDGDQFRDLLIPAGPVFAVALSGRDGQTIWKDSDGSANSRGYTSGRRSLLVLPTAGGTMLIGPDPSGSGLRAVVLTKAARPLFR